MLDLYLLWKALEVNKLLCTTGRRKLAEVCNGLWRFFSSLLAKFKGRHIDKD